MYKCIYILLIQYNRCKKFKLCNCNNYKLKYEKMYKCIYIKTIKCIDLCNAKLIYIYMFCYLKGGSPVFHLFMSVVVKR